MAEMAEWEAEQGLLSLPLHRQGLCGSWGPCPHCEIELESNMAGQVIKSKLLSKYGAKVDAAVKGHAKDDTNYGFIRVPPGINNGIAKLTDCGFGIYKTGDNKGEYYFRAAGVVIQPYAINTPDGKQVVAGLQTSVMVPCCDTKNAQGQMTTQDQHFDQICNELRKLGADPDELAQGVVALEAIAENLHTAANDAKNSTPIYFKFSTSPRLALRDLPNGTKKGDVTGVWENWHGIKGLEDFVPESLLPTIPDNSGTVPPPSVNGVATPGAYSDTEDIMSLAKSADAGDKPSARKLKEQALKLNFTEEQIDGAQSWEQLAIMMQSGGTEATTTEEAQEEEVQEEEVQEESNDPAVGKCYNYKPIDKTTKKPGKTVVKIEIIEVDEKGKKVNAKNLAKPNTVYKGIKWEALEPL